MVEGWEGWLLLQKRQKLSTYGEPNYISWINSRGHNYDYPFFHTDEHFDTRKEDFFPLKTYIYLDIWQNNAGLRVLYDFTFFLWTTNNEIENFKWNVDAIHFAENLKINFPIF